MKHFRESEVQEIRLDAANYPKLLREIRDPPNPLRIIGSLPPYQKCIAISGSRSPTQEALQAAHRIGTLLAEHGYTVVTGLAEGCDEAATDGALSAGGTVVGVVACGLKAIHAQPRKRLSQEIFKTGGAVISEYDNFSKPSRSHYLQRNKIITGLSEKTIIIAARERSGSAATARGAIQQGREVIITRYVKAKLEPVKIVRDPRELKTLLSVTTGNR